MAFSNEYKPDGYLLKSSGKDTLLETIRRFFAEKLFRISLSESHNTIEEYDV